MYLAFVIAGRVVFTTKRFTRGEFLQFYEGELITHEEGKYREAVKETGFRYFFTYKGKGYW